MLCPNCTTTLNKNPKHAEGIWQCNWCKGVFHIVITTKPKKDRTMNKRHIQIDHLADWFENSGVDEWTNEQVVQIIRKWQPAELDDEDSLSAITGETLDKLPEIG